MMLGPSRREFDMLRDQVGGNASRLDVIDQSGTRGVGAISVQMTEVIKDVADIKAKVDAHSSVHDQEERQRVLSRRWLIGTILAMMALIETPILYLVTQGH